jgi:hypothetical protein
MSTSLIIAAVLNWGVALALFGIGIDYVRSTVPKPHHLKMLDVSWDSLTPMTRLLIMTLLRGTGLVAGVTGVFMGILLYEPYSRQEPWSRWAVLIAGCATLVPTLLGTVRVRRQSGPYAPMWPHFVMLTALGVAFWLNRGFGAATGSLP